MSVLYCGTVGRPLNTDSDDNIMTMFLYDFFIRVVVNQRKFWLIEILTSLQATEHEV